MSTITIQNKISQSVINQIDLASKALALNVLKTCSEKYKFNYNDALSELELENLSMISRTTEKKPRKLKVKNAKYVLPYIPDMKYTGCNALCWNNGLFTPCGGELDNMGDYCKSCATEGFANENGIPSCGNLTRRRQMGLSEYTDLNGRNVVHYTRVLKTLKLNLDDMISYAGNNNIVIPDEHLKIKNVSNTSDGGEKKRGRPKKSQTLVESVQPEDLFKTLCADEQGSKLTIDDLVSDDAEENEIDESNNSDHNIVALDVVDNNLAKVTKEQAKVAKEQAKVAKEELEQAKVAAKELAKLEKEQAKVAAKEQPIAPAPMPTTDANVSEIKVKRITDNGNIYLLDYTNNIVYNTDSEKVGKWVPNEKKICFCDMDDEDDDDEEEEEH